MMFPARVTRVPTRPLLAFQLREKMRTHGALTVPGMKR
jgi:hypothetical protein